MNEKALLHNFVLCSIQRRKILKKQMNCALNRSRLFDKQILHKHLNLNSYLSNEVEAILSSAKSNESDSVFDEKIWLNKHECLLDTNYLNTFIVQETSADINFSQSLKNIAKYFQDIRLNLMIYFDPKKHVSRFLQADVELFTSKIVRNMNFRANALADERSTIQNDLQLEFVFLVIFPIVERSLGNLVYSLSDFAESKVPFLLRDLINQPILARSMPQSTINLLKLLIYTPKSLNLRNLGWHGFMNKRQYDENLIYFLIALLCSINHRLAVQNIELKARKMFDLNEIEYLKANSVLLSNFRHKYKNEFRLIIARSNLIDEERKALWNFVFCSEHKNTFDLMALILPELEHLLRKLYSLSNNFQYGEVKNKVEFSEINKIQKASTSEFYFIMNDLLQFSLKNEANSNFRMNNLVNYLLNDRLIFLLFEMFDYMDGPRLRDHLSHGEMCPKNIDSYFLNMLLFICINVCLIESENTQLLEGLGNFLELRQLVYSEYEPNFHPIGCLKIELIKFVSNHDALRNNSVLNERTEFKIKEEFASLIGLFSLEEIDYENLVEFLKNEWKFDNFSYHLSFRYKKFYENSSVDKLKIETFKSSESQLINLLRSIILSLMALTQRVEQFLSRISGGTNEKPMRERRRKNVQSFFDSFGSINSWLELSKVLFVLIIHKFIFRLSHDFFDARRTSVFTIYLAHDRLISRLVKLLKALLRLNQNLMSKIDSNKWTECEQLVLSKLKFDSSVYLFLIQ